MEFIDDEISRPNVAWIEAHNHRMSYSFQEPDFADLRKWGYVMWDKARLKWIGQRLLTVGASKQGRSSRGTEG